MDDAAGNSRKLPVEIGDDAIHPALLARALCLNVKTGPILDPVGADQGREIGSLGIQPGIDLVVGDEPIGRDPVRIFTRHGGSFAERG